MRPCTVHLSIYLSIYPSIYIIHITYNKEENQAHEGVHGFGVVAEAEVSVDKPRGSVCCRHHALLVRCPVAAAFTHRTYNIHTRSLTTRTRRCAYTQEMHSRVL